MGKQHNNFSKDIEMLSEAYGRVHHPTEQIIKEGIDKLSDNGKVVLRQYLHQEGILGAIAGGLLGNALAPGIGAEFLKGLGIPEIGGAAAGAYLGHKASEDSESRDKTGHLSDHDLLDAAEDAGTSGPKLLARAREELKDGSLDDDTRDALARDVYAHWAHGDPDAKDHLSEDEEVIMEGILSNLARVVKRHLPRLVPGVGTARDLANAGIASGRGNAGKAALDAASKIPVLGHGVNAAKKGAETGLQVAKDLGAAVPGVGYGANIPAGDEEDVSAFAVGDIVYGNDGEEVVVDIEQGTVFTMELGQGGNMYGDHPQAAPISELSKIDIDTDFVEDQETGYEAHMDELGKAEGFTGSGKGHATD